MIQGQDIFSMIQSLDKYIQESPNNLESNVQELGLTKDGRIVRISECAVEDRELANKKLCESISIVYPEVTLSKQESIDTIYKALKERKVQQVVSQKVTEKNEKDILRARIDKLKDKYKTQLDNLEKYTKTNSFDNGDGIVECYTLNKRAVLSDCNCFFNTYSPDQWIFQNNKKSPSTQHVFYMSNVVVMQLEKAATVKGFSYQFPKIIQRSNIINFKTDEVIREYMGKHNTNQFKEEFLNTTVNGKSTQRITEDLGMTIEKLEVEIGTLERRHVNTSEMRQWSDEQRAQWLKVIEEHPFVYSVNLHVSPVIPQKML